MPNSTSIPNPFKASDAQLVEAARHGDKKAFVEIVHRYQNLTTGVTLAILRDFALGEDAAQEAFVLAWQKINTLKDGNRLRPWLCQIARNTALNHAKKRHPEGSLETSLIDPSPRPDELAISRDERTTVLSALDSLPEKYRLPLVLYYREDQSIKAVAKTLSRSEVTIRKQLSRGRSLLKQQVADLLKSALPRTAPGPVFTATVAGLIGAMLKPTAVAATAFSAKPLTTSAAAMTTSKLTLTTAAIITAVCIPAGYTARTLIQTKAVQAPLEITSLVPSSKRESYDPTLSPIAMEWQELLASCQNDPKAFPNLYQTISEIPGSLRREAFLSLLIVEWVRLDPDSGLTFVRSKDYSQEQQELFAREWIKEDINAAIDGLLRGGPGWDIHKKIQVADIKDGTGWSAVLGSLLVEIATRAPERLKEIIEALPQNGFVRTHGAFVEYFAIDPKAALEIANSLTGGRQRLALSGITAAWSEEDLAGALAYVQSIEDPAMRANLVSSTISSLSWRDPLQTLNYLKTAPPGMMNLSRGAMQNLAEKDFPAALKWVSENPDWQAIEGLESQFSHRLRLDPTALIDTLHTAGVLKVTTRALFGHELLTRPSDTRTLVWDKLIELGSDPGAAHLQKKIIALAACEDPKPLMTLVDRLPDGQERQILTLEAAKRIAAHAGPHSAFTRDPFGPDKSNEDFSKVIEAAPENWQKPLIEEAFKAMKGDQFGQSEHLDLWESYFDQLPGSERPEAVQKLALGIALRSPEKMADFFSSLKSEDEQFKAGIAFVEATRGPNPGDGSQWLENTPMSEALRTRIRLGEKPPKYDPFQ